MMYREYLILFHLLDYCYNKFDPNDDLPPLLGEMCPYLFKGGMPMDREVFNDWHKMCSDIKSNQDLLERINMLLVSYEKKYHFDFEDTKRALQCLTDEEINKVIQKI